MAQSPVFYRRQHGWDTTSTDYHHHVSTMERMPSVLPDVPRYPSVFRAFNNNNNNNSIQEEDFEVISQEHIQKKKHQQHTTKPGKKVQLVEQEQIIPQGKCETIVEENIDSETDGFLQQRHKGFELCKWKTFKMH